MVLPRLFWRFQTCGFMPILRLSLDEKKADFLRSGNDQFVGPACAFVGFKPEATAKAKSALAVPSL